MAKQRCTFTPDFKFRVVLELLTGEKRAAQLCREHQVSEASLGQWRQRFLEHGAQVFESGNGTSAEQERIAGVRADGGLPVSGSGTTEADEPSWPGVGGWERGG